MQKATCVQRAKPERKPRLIDLGRIAAFLATKTACFSIYDQKYSTFGSKQYPRLCLSVQNLRKYCINVMFFRLLRQNFFQISQKGNRWNRDPQAFLAPFSA